MQKKIHYALLDSVYHFLKSAYKSALPRRPLPPKELPRRRALPRIRSRWFLRKLQGDSENYSIFPNLA